MAMYSAKISLCIMDPKFTSYSHIMKQHGFGGCARLKQKSIPSSHTISCICSVLRRSLPQAFYTNCP